MFKTYAMLTKPGIIAGNLITTAGAFALASKHGFDWLLFLTTLIGLGLVIASACVFNNYIDRHIDQKMARTKSRAFAQGSVAPTPALIAATMAVLTGLWILAAWVNLTSALLAAFGFFGYVVMYSIWKYRSTYGTLIGSFAGAAPPVIGYTAAGGHLDLGAALLFSILVFWQMPHFYSIAIYRHADYAAASLPLLPLIRGNHVAKIHMISYIAAFMAAISLLYFLGYIQPLAVTLALLSGFAWFWLCLKGLRAQDDPSWARQMFRVSLIAITIFSILIAF